MSFIFAFIFLSSSIHLLYPNKTEIFEISSQEAEIIQNKETKTTQLSYSKKVHINWKELKLTTEQLKLELQNKQNSHISCPQHVHVSYQDLTIDADQATCNVPTEQIHLSGNVIVTKELSNKEKNMHTTSHADRMIIDLKTKKTMLFGLEKQPVKTVILTEK